MRGMRETSWSRFPDYGRRLVGPTGVTYTACGAE